MKVAGLFAGIGGLELGLSSAGHEPVLFAENWAPAAAVLKSHFDVENRGDVTELRSLPRGVELLTAGFPCQDLSQAGMTAGIAGKRSGLVQAVFALLKKRRTPWVLLENVSFMLSLDRGAAMTRLVEAFEDLGYRWAYRVVNTLAWLPQRRERVYFLASRVADPADVLFADDAPARERKTSLTTHANGFYWTEGIRGLGWGPDCIPTLKVGSGVGIPAPPAILMPDGLVVTPDITDAERLQGFPRNWTFAATSVARASSRWSLVGNAVSVPAAGWLGRRLREPGSYDADRDVEWRNKRWPRAARYDGKRRYAVEIGDRPETVRKIPLHRFLKVQGKPLSARATAGFLERTGRSSLRFPPGFLHALQLHLRRMSGEKVRHFADDLPLFAA
jgi:DNA (cytosine-5)-methyltransferase 1